jgi:hypothetical protein
VRRCPAGASCPVGQNRVTLALACLAVGAAAMVASACASRWASWRTLSLDHEARWLMMVDEAAGYARLRLREEKARSPGLAFGRQLEHYAQ